MTAQYENVLVHVHIADLAPKKLLKCHPEEVVHVLLIALRVP